MVSRWLRWLGFSMVWVIFTSLPAIAYVTNYDGHVHTSFPAKPDGLAAIVGTFGAACNGESNDNATTYVANSGTSWSVVYHRKLGPAGGSTVIPAVKGHQAWTGYLNQTTGNVADGWFGYNCRYISGTTTWSTHAWGIAIDGNTIPEHQWERHCHYHYTKADHRQIFVDHRFTDGIAFCDPMHMQYATGY